MSHAISNSQSFTTEKKVCVKDYEQLGRDYVATEVPNYQKKIDVGKYQMVPIKFWWFTGDQLKIWQRVSIASNCDIRH